MTLGELINLYKAEQEGKQIVCEKRCFRHYDTKIYTFDTKLADINLEELLNFKDNENVVFYIKEEK